MITRPSGAPIEVMLPLVGEAAALDLVAAIAAVEAASGWTLTSPMVEEGLAGVRAPEGRARIRDLPNGPLVLDDTYNANPASMRAALDTLRELAQARAARAVVVIGEMKDIDAAKLEEFKAFFKQYYVPNNAVLTIAGDIDAAKTKALIASYFGPIPCWRSIHAGNLTREIGFRTCRCWF